MSNNISQEIIDTLPDGRMSIKNASKYIGCSRQHLMKCINLGVGPALYKVVNTLYIYKNDIDKWIELQKVQSTMFSGRKIVQKRRQDDEVSSL